MRLVLISLDAVAQPDTDRLLSLPALSQLKKDGVFCNTMRTVYPTLTYPIHTSLITGCYPDRHGISHNEPFQPDVPAAMRVWHWRQDEIKTKTLWEAAREAGLDVASILWPVSGKAYRDIRRNFPEILPLPGENATLKMLKYASPIWIMRMELKYGKQRKSIKQPDLDDYAALLAEKLILSHRAPDVLTIHLVDCDAMRHEYGISSPEAQNAMERLDRRIAKIVHALKSAGFYDDTILCVVSDHGQEDARISFPLDRVLHSQCNARAQSTGMGAYIFGDDLSTAVQVLRENQISWHIGHIYTEDELRAIHAPREVHLAVDAAAGCRFFDGETENGQHIGDHGFSLSDPAANTLLWLSGPCFRKGVTLEKANAVDIAPTLAKALGLSLPDTDGTVLNDAFLEAYK